MLSCDDLARLKRWKRQLNAAIAAQELRLKKLERRILRTGRLPKEVARLFASLEKAIVACRNTVAHLEATSRVLAKVIDFQDRQVKGARRRECAHSGSAWLQPPSLFAASKVIDHEQRHVGCDH